MTYIRLLGLSLILISSLGYAQVVNLSVPILWLGSNTRFEINGVLNSGGGIRMECTMKSPQEASIRFVYSEIDKGDYFIACGGGWNGKVGLARLELRSNNGYTIVGESRDGSSHFARRVGSVSGPILGAKLDVGSAVSFSGAFDTGALGANAPVTVNMYLCLESKSNGLQCLTRQIKAKHEQNDFNGANRFLQVASVMQGESDGKTVRIIGDTRIVTAISMPGWAMPKIIIDAKDWSQIESIEVLPESFSREIICRAGSRCEFLSGTSTSAGSVFLRSIKLRQGMKPPIIPILTQFVYD